MVGVFIHFVNFKKDNSTKSKDRQKDDFGKQLDLAFSLWFPFVQHLELYTQMQTSDQRLMQYTARTYLRILQFYALFH
jgi:hypothetical protein